jgi:hypothetical protein
VEARLSEARSAINDSDELPDGPLSVPC